MSDPIVLDGVEMVLSPRLMHQMCFSKKAYPTQAEARKQLRRINKLHGLECRDYRCRVCGEWHLTKKDYK